MKFNKWILSLLFLIMIALTIEGATYYDDERVDPNKYKVGDIVVSKTPKSEISSDMKDIWIDQLQLQVNELSEENESYKDEIIKLTKENNDLKSSFEHYVEHCTNDKAKIKALTQALGDEKLRELCKEKPFVCLSPRSM